MSLRNLPKLDLGVVAASAVEVSATALARYDDTIVAREKVDNSISILDPIGANLFGDGVTVKRIAAALRSIGERDVVVNINSPGGEMFEGLAIYNALREHRGKVTVRILGVAASAASLIAMAGDQIEIARTGFLMIHNAQVGDGGDRHTKRSIADKLELFDAAMASLYEDRTSLPAAEIAAMMDAETFITGEEAVEKGFADALLSSDEVARAPRAEMTAIARLDTALARGDRMPRAERRMLFKEITGTPNAADEDATPRAGDAAVSDGLVGLSIALARLKLV